MKVIFRGLGNISFFKRTRDHIRTLVHVEVTHECFFLRREQNAAFQLRNLHLWLLAATCFLQSLLKNQCRTYSCFPAPCLYIIDFYISRTLNDISSANLLVFVIQFFTGSGNNCEKKLNSREALGTKKNQKETNFNEDRLIQVYLAGKPAR